MYTEFFIPIFSYFKTLKGKRDVIIYEWLIPTILTCFYFFYGNNFNSLKELAVNVLCIMLGISLAIVTLLVTGGIKNLDEIKKYESDSIINGKKISLYKLLMLNFTYSIILELIVILMCILGTAFPIDNILLIKISHSILCFFNIHIFLLTIRNMTNLYLIVTKQ
ncbi:hypothetical protein [Apibacter adventoris]|uniref:Uncharacterized protein n=1 Tax=Apibacter adventoris TaxID=1679466 RepID=A0A2S8A8C7_9FLAO|nr:hypothetical protein [Apibacter adventoris]PQL90813.1 hypothetical protein C4S77_10190 [Apibacter adventoris]